MASYAPIVRPYRSNHAHTLYKNLTANASNTSVASEANPMLEIDCHAHFEPRNAFDELDPEYNH